MQKNDLPDSGEPHTGATLETKDHSRPEADHVIETVDELRWIHVSDDKNDMDKAELDAHAREWVDHMNKIVYGQYSLVEVKVATESKPCMFQIRFQRFKT